MNDEAPANMAYIYGEFVKHHSSFFLPDPGGFEFPKAYNSWNRCWMIYRLLCNPILGCIGFETSDFNFFESEVQPNSEMYGDNNNSLKLRNEYNNHASMKHSTYICRYSCVHYFSDRSLLIR